MTISQLFCKSEKLKCSLQNVSLRPTEVNLFDCHCSPPLMLVVMTALRPARWLFALLALPVSSSSTSKMSVSSTWQPRTTSLRQPLYTVSAGALLQATQASHLFHTYPILYNGQWKRTWKLVFMVFNIFITEIKTSGPIPVPRYAKNRLIALCKDIAYRVKCTACSKVLTSHMEAKAHFK